MKDILFRGLWVHGNKEWIEGDLVRDSEGKPHIVDSKYVDYWHGEPIFVCEEECEVIPETVGQYTGLTDKNGKKVFEGDIVAYKDGNNKVGYVKVEYDCVFGLFLPFGDSDSALETKEVEVVGNVFDNAELLEVK